MYASVKTDVLSIQNDGRGKSPWQIISHMCPNILQILIDSKYGSGITIG